MRKRVVIASPLIPGAAALAASIPWVEWQTDSQRLARKVDSLIVVRPIELVGKISLRDAAAQLLRETFGFGAVYQSGDVARLLESHCRDVHA